MLVAKPIKMCILRIFGDQFLQRKMKNMLLNDILDFFIAISIAGPFFFFFAQD